MGLATAIYDGGLVTCAMWAAWSRVEDVGRYAALLSRVQRGNACRGTSSSACTGGGDAAATSGGRGRGRRAGGRRCRVSDTLATRVLPLHGIEDAVLAHLDRDVKITVTASPGRDLDATLEMSERLARAGYAVVPHVSARLVRDAAHLRDVVASARQRLGA